MTATSERTPGATGRGIGRWLPALGRLWRGRAKAPPQPTGEVAWAEGLFFGTVPLARWNPDELARRHGGAVHRRMLEDDQIKALLAFKRAAVTARPWRFRLPRETAAHRRCEAFFRFVLEQQLEGTFGQVLAGMMTSQVHGFSVLEKVHAAVDWQGRTRWGLAALKLRPAASFTFVTDVHGNLVSLQQQQGARQADLDPARFVRHVNKPEVNAHYGASDLLECHRHWWAKDQILKQANFAALAQGAAGAPPLAPTSLMWTGQASGGSLNVSAALVAPLGGVLGSNALFHARDQRASGTHGGDFTAGAWQTRTLQTLPVNQVSGASLAGSQITLPAGTYSLEAHAPAWIVNRHQAKLRNVSDGADVLIGSTEYTLATAAVMTASVVRGLFVLPAAKVLELQHRCETTRLVNGFGNAGNFGVDEVYAEVAIWKLA